MVWEEQLKHAKTQPVSVVSFRKFGTFSSENLTYQDLRGKFGNLFSLMAPLKVSCCKVLLGDLLHEFFCMVLVVCLVFAMFFFGL